MMWVVGLIAVSALLVADATGSVVRRIKAARAARREGPSYRVWLNRRKGPPKGGKG